MFSDQRRQRGPRRLRCGPGFASDLLRQPEGFVVDQLADGRHRTKRQRLHELRRNLPDPQPGEAAKTEAVIIARITDQRGAFVVLPQPQKDLGHQGAADSLTMPRGQYGERPISPQPSSAPIRAPEAAR